MAHAENKQDGQGDEVAAWLEDIGLIKYASLLRAIGYEQLEQISELGPKEFKDSLKKAFEKDIQLANKIGFSEVSAPDLAKFATHVRKLTQQAEGMQNT